MTSEEIGKRFGKYYVSQEWRDEREGIRREFIDFAEKMDAMLPEGESKSQWLARLSEAYYWATRSHQEDNPKLKENLKKTELQD